MSCSYAEGLSPYEYKGKLGLKEKFDTDEDVKRKVVLLAEWITSSKHVVVHTGAGISTSAGIPDFRGPRGVWTLEAEGKKPHQSISFDEAIPTRTHMALKKLLQTGKIHYIVSQNIDGLHLRSGIPRKFLSELHGNMLIEECTVCKRQCIMSSATTSVGLKNLGRKCRLRRLDGRPCRGSTRDTILDWEHDLPRSDLLLADYHSSVADLSICLGTTLQIVPSGNLPVNTKKYSNGKLVICNLQPTKQDKKADLIINSYVDDVMSMLLEVLDLKIDEYDREVDPMKMGILMEWTIEEKEVERMRKRYLECLKSKKRKREDGEDKRGIKGKVGGWSGAGESMERNGRAKEELKDLKKEVEEEMEGVVEGGEEEWNGGVVSPVKREPG